MAAILCLAFAFTAPVCGAEDRKPDAFPKKLDGSGVDNLYQLADGLYSGSKPNGEEGFRFLAKLGIKTILSVDGTDPDVVLAKKHGIGYVHVPLSYDAIKEVQAVQIVKTAVEQPGPLYVHCHYGMNRGPCASAIICMAQHGWTAEQAVAWMKKAGTSSACAGLFRDVRAFKAPYKTGEHGVQQRIEARGFPSVFQAWNPATNMHDESPLHTLARHDLVWHDPQFFRLKWNNRHIGLADGFDKESIETGKAFRQKLLSLNPNLIFIAEIRYRDAHKSYLPEGHAWWLRDNQGRIFPGWDEGGFLCLDFHNPEFRRQVAKQAKAAVASGVVDGVMLDWWSDDASRLALVKEVREAIGESALIICNANDRTTPQTARFINGYFMECTQSKTPQDWKKIADTLTWAEKNLRSPRVNCLETWFHQSRDDLHLMRATTTLALTHSDGYCLFSDPNPLPTP
ncbi:MAG: dual specificity protein phosphatase, partial [Thermoguttaceae bacterium]